MFEISSLTNPFNEFAKDLYIYMTQEKYSSILNVLLLYCHTELRTFDIKRLHVSKHAF